MTTRSRQLQSFVLATILAIGAGVAWCLISQLTIGIVSESLPSDIVNERVVVLRDGTPVIETACHNYAWITYRTLQNKPTTVSSSDRCESVHLPGPGYLHSRFIGVPWRQRIARVDVPTQDSSAWYLLHNGRREGRGHFVGYDRQTNLLIGYIGRDGFHPDEPPAEEQFPIDGRRMSGPGVIFQRNGAADGTLTSKAGMLSPWRVVIMTDEGLTEVDFMSRKVRTILTEPKLIWAWTWTASDGESPAQRRPPTPAIVVRLPNKMVVCDPTGKRLKAYPLSPELRDATLQWYPIRPDKALITKRSYSEQIDTEQIYGLDASGKIIRQEHAVLHNPYPWRIPGNAILSITAPSPGALAAALAVVQCVRADHPESERYSTAIVEAWTHFRVTLLIMLIISSVLAVLCFLRQRKYGLPWTWPWTLLVLVFGVPAYLGYLVHRVWPARLPCPHCGRLAPRDRPACLACGREFPAPAPKGTEVFA